jgi:competence protein ComEA
MRNLWMRYQDIILRVGVPLVLILLMLVLLGLFLKSRAEAQGSVELSVNESAENTSSDLTVNAAVDNDLPTLTVVYVAGGVVNPGVYRLTDGSLVADAIAAAGGYSQECDLLLVEQSLNLADALQNGQKVYIPRQGDSLTTQLTDEGSGSSVSVDDGKININHATQSALMDLGGIGEVYSQKIIDNRPYQSIGELVTKKVIPSSTFEKIKDEICI